MYTYKFLALHFTGYSSMLHREVLSSCHLITMCVASNASFNQLYMLAWRDSTEPQSQLL